MSGSVDSKFGTRRSRAAAGHDPQVGSGHVAQVEAADVERVEAAVVDQPRVAAERAARQLVLRPVVVAAPAAEELQPAVAAHVVARAEARRDLVADAELDRVLEDLGLERRDRLVLGPQAEVQREPVADRPLVLHVERVDVGAGRAAHAAIVDLVVAVGAAPAVAREREAAVPEDVHVAAGIRLVGVVDRVLVAEAALERVVAPEAEAVVVVDVDEAALGRVVVHDQRARRVLRADRPLDARGHAGHADARRLVDVVGDVRDAGVLVVVVEVAAAHAEERRGRQRDVDVARRVHLVDLEAAIEVDAVAPRTS